MRLEKGGVQWCVRAIRFPTGQAYMQACSSSRTDGFHPTAWTLPLAVHLPGERLEEKKHALTHTPQGRKALHVSDDSRADL